MCKELQELCAEVLNFKTNLTKDNQDRRFNLELINKKLRNLDQIEERFHEIESNLVVKVDEPKILESIKSISLTIELSRLLLLERRNIVQSETMTDKFDLKTATSLLPVMTNSELVTGQLIDAIELYGTMLDEAGKKLLINYVLKTRLSPSAKLRLNQNYTDIGALVKDIVPLIL